MKRILPLLLLAFPACERADYHGIDPKVYNETLYPKKLKVATDQRSETFFFDRNKAFDAENQTALSAFVGKLPRGGAESIVLTFGDHDQDKHLYAIRALRSKGFQKRVMKTVVDTLADANSVRIDLQTAVVVLPDCPDWRKSNTTNYSNTLHSNSTCSTVTNTGRMIANPRDIEKSNVDYIPADGTLDSAAIGAYRGDAAAASTVTTATQATSSSNANSSSASSTGQ